MARLCRGRRRRRGHEAHEAHEAHEPLPAEPAAARSELPEQHAPGPLSPGWEAAALRARLDAVAEAEVLAAQFLAQLDVLLAIYDENSREAWRWVDPLGEHVVAEANWVCNLTAWGLERRLNQSLAVRAVPCCASCCRPVGSVSRTPSPRPVPPVDAATLDPVAVRSDLTGELLALLTGTTPTAAVGPDPTDVDADVDADQPAHPEPVAQPEPVAPVALQRGAEPAQAERARAEGAEAERAKADGADAGHVDVERADAVRADAKCVGFDLVRAERAEEQRRETEQAESEHHQPDLLAGGTVDQADLDDAASDAAGDDAAGDNAAGDDAAGDNAVRDDAVSGGGPAAAGSAAAAQLADRAAELIGRRRPRGGVDEVAGLGPVDPDLLRELLSIDSQQHGLRPGCPGSSCGGSASTRPGRSSPSTRSRFRWTGR